VIVMAVTPLADAGLPVAVTVDVPGSTLAPIDVKAMAGCWLSVTPPATAVTVWDPAPVELNVPVVTPVGSVVFAGCVIVLPLPVADSVTAIPLSGLPLPSLTVIVTVLLPPAVNDAGAAATVDCDAETWEAGFTMTAAVCVIAVPLIVAETVFVPATVEVRVLVKTPLPFVVPEVGLSVLPVPVDATLTLWPLIVLPLPSLAVTLMVEDPLPAVNDVGAAETVEFVAETPPPPPPPEEWQAVLPESVYVLPATGTNLKA